ncbi:MAG: hypothetical protein KatS3mg043_0145 [Rhodothermaceae bacterium]|nr:MAG: hypothetical protein KatS3mg043_0145 [Rhodothermaceae bacterium]
MMFPRTGWTLLLLVFWTAGALEAPAQEVEIDTVPLASVRFLDREITLDVVSGMAQGLVSCEVGVNLDRVDLVASLDTPLPEGVRLLVRGESGLGPSLGSRELSGREDGRVTLVSSLARGHETGCLLTLTVLVEPGFDVLPLRRTLILSLYDPVAGSWAEARQTLLLGSPGAVASPGRR